MEFIFKTQLMSGCFYLVYVVHRGIDFQRFIRFYFIKILQMFYVVNTVQFRRSSIIGIVTD